MSLKSNEDMPIPKAWKGLKGYLNSRVKVSVSTFPKVMTLYPLLVSNIKFLIEGILTLPPKFSA